MGRVGKGKGFRGQAINPQALRTARQQAGLTLAQAADGIVTRQAFSQFELGRARPLTSNLQAIANRLNVAVEALVANPHDPREVAMGDLEDQSRWPELERLAARVIADRNVTRRMQAVACFYLGRALHNQAPEEAIGYFRQARSALGQAGELHLAAEARDWEAASLYLMQDPTALDVGRDALARYRLLLDRDPRVEARMLEHIGSYHLQRLELAEAQASYREALDAAGVHINLARLANIYHGMASGAVRSGQMRSALDYFERAVQLARTEVNVRGTVTPNLARLENDYGDLLLRTGALERAEEMIQAALDHLEVAGVTTTQASTMLTMGDVKRQRGQLDEAMCWVGRAIELAERLGERVSLATAYQQLGELAAAAGDRDRCEASFSRALEILERAGLSERHAQAYERYRRTCLDEPASQLQPSG